MPILKFVSWNMEWMNDLFDEAGNYRADGDHPQHADKNVTVLQRRKDLSGVINEISPDVIVIIEGPNKSIELQRFFDTDVQGTWKVTVQASVGSAQCIGCAVRTDTGKLDATSPMNIIDSATVAAFNPFEADNDDDGVMEKYRFERLPLYVEIKTSDQKKFRVLGLHLKSKGIFDAYEWSKWWSISDGNRKKIMAQCSQVRQKFADPYLQDVATKDIPIIICGDINDGPGLDASEKRLFGSGIERLMGNVWLPLLCFGNALFDSLTKKEKDELKFENIFTTTFKDPIFNNVWHKDWIDHILYSHLKLQWIKKGMVYLKMNDGKPIYQKYKHASDHMPVGAEIDL